jgi:hypothetical protein
LKGKNGAFSTILPHHQEEDNVTEKQLLPERKRRIHLSLRFAQ